MLHMRVIAELIPSLELFFDCFVIKEKRFTEENGIRLFFAELCGFFNQIFSLFRLKIVKIW